MQKENNSTNTFAYPVDHLSYSSIMMFLRNRFAFKKCYILKIYDFKSSPAALVGKACHKALEQFYRGATPSDAADVGLTYINAVSDDDIEWGKTGSREKAIKDFTNAFNGYIAEAPHYTQIIGVEKSITAFIEHEGQQLGLPVKCVTDLITRNDANEIEITDHKFVSQYTDSEAEDGALVIQAMCNYHAVKSELGEAPKRMIFNEYKVSANRNGEAQLQPYVIEFDQHPEYHDIFLNIYNAVTSEIARPDCLYLPNMQDRFDFGGDTFRDYKAQTITIESPIVVQHKTGDFQFKEKKFVSAPTDVVDNAHLAEEEKIRVKLLEFGIPVEMQQTYRGSSVIQYTMKASRGVRMSSIEKHKNDLALALKAKTIRVQAPIPGTDTVGVEVPNPERITVPFYMDDNSLNPQLGLEAGSTRLPIGVNVYGETIHKELKDMPHLLIAGTTGSGKSVGMNVFIRSLAEQNTSDQLKFIMIDPKRVELTHFKNLPNLIPPIIYDTEKAVKALWWVVDRMEERYTTLEAVGARNLDEYNRQSSDTMDRIVVVIDEFADLMLTAPEGGKATAEKAIIRLAQKARAVGIHLIIATQRPSVDVVTGLIKANFPTRLAYMTASRTDSMVVLDEPGAHELVGAGDCLFLDPSTRGLQRLQSFYV